MSRWFIPGVTVSSVLLLIFFGAVHIALSTPQGGLLSEDIPHARQEVARNPGDLHARNRLIRYLQTKGETSDRYTDLKDVETEVQEYLKLAPADVEKSRFLL